jgi:hypothetical protein
VNDHGSRLREAFETHESLAPDPAEVYAEVQRLARAHQRRRRGAQAAGGAVLGAGLIAGMINLPGLLPGTAPDHAAVVAPGAVVPSASASASASAQEQEQLRAESAYFAAGYGYGDALKLAAMWNRPSGDIGLVKAEAGRKLLAGERLPFPATPETPDGSPRPGSEEAQVAAFFAAGYDYADAVRLAGLWRLPEPHGAKIEGGKRLLAGETLPFQP